jgi:hypothetical protein
MIPPRRDISLASLDNKSPCRCSGGASEEKIFTSGLMAKKAVRKDISKIIRKNLIAHLFSFSRLARFT